MTRDDLVVALSHPNVGAFLAVIREGETNQTETAYRMMFGGDLFDAPPWQHPRKAITRNGITSTAAGAPQFLAKTWDALVAQYGFEDFSPANQDLGAIALIAGRKALDAVKGGRLDEALRLCAREWASLPGSPYGQPTLKAARALAVFQQYGGTVAATTAPQAQEVKPMGVLFPLLQLAGEFVPQLLSQFGSGSEVSNRNIAAAKVVSDAIVAATESPNLQAAVEKMQSDPRAVQAATIAVATIWPDVFEAGGGGIDGARKAAASSDGDFKKVVFSAPFLLAGAVLPLIYAVVAAALLKADWLADITSEVRTGVITSVTGLVLGSLMGYFYGTSASSAKKDATLAAR